MQKPEETDGIQDESYGDEDVGNKVKNKMEKRKHEHEANKFWWLKEEKKKEKEVRSEGKKREYVNQQKLTIQSNTRAEINDIE